MHTWPGSPHIPRGEWVIRQARNLLMNLKDHACSWCIGRTGVPLDARSASAAPKSRAASSASPRLPVPDQVIDVGDPAGAGQLQREQGLYRRRMNGPSITRSGNVTSLNEFGYG